MSKSIRELQELMTAVDAGHAVDSTSSDNSNSKLLGSHRRSTYNGRGAAGVRKTSPSDASFEFSAGVRKTSPADASFEFGTLVNNSYSSASPASMVFSDGQLRVHQFPAVRSSTTAGGGSNQQPAMSPVRTSSVGSYSTKQQARVTESKKRVSFAMDGAGKAGGGQGKKSGGLLGCCGLSSRNEAVEPVARNDNRKVEAF